MKPRPTISELDAILNSEEDLDITVLPDGSITTKERNVEEQGMPVGDMAPRDTRPRFSTQRRKELAAFANEAVDWIMAKNIKPNGELCLFRRMVENLLPGE